MTLEEVAGIVGGRLVDAAPKDLLRGPAFLDSRKPEPAGLFVAFAGENVDGHDYAMAAIEGGAAAVLGTRATGAPTVLVEDAQVALQVLARAVLQRLREETIRLRVIAITGSQGKTTAKDMLARVLADAGATVATAGSFNNELGLPLTVLRADRKTGYLVLEMGARGVGHLAELCAIAPPDVSVVLNVGKAHIGEFGSRELIAVAKGELVDALAPDGAAVLNLDDPLVAAMESRTTASTWTFGHAAAAAVRLGEVEVDDLGRASFDLNHRGKYEHIALQLLGEHQAINAAATTAAALAAGLELGRIADSLRAIDRLSPMRMELHERADGLVVINDAYNANPDSMRSALETLARMGSSGRRTVAVLGEMRELGGTAEEEHRQVGLLLGRLGIDAAVVVGEGARGVYDALADDAADLGHVTTRYVETATEAGEWLRENVAGPDVVLVKASRSGRLETVVDLLVGDQSNDVAEDGKGPVR